MKKVLTALLSLASLTVLAAPALADGSAVTRLRGFDEVPAISSPGTARFEAVVDEVTNRILWTMTYSDLNGSITQSHIHFGQKGVNGGISIFLCSNLGNGPAGTQACPPAPATISGVIQPGNVGAGAAAQGIQAGDFGPILRALRVGVTYVNIHTNLYPGGEIRGQLVFTPDAP